MMRAAADTPVRLRAVPQTQSVMKTTHCRSTSHVALTLAALVSAAPLASQAGLLESFETAVPADGGDPPFPYLALTQSSTVGVTQGTQSFKLEFDTSNNWKWLGINYGNSSYADYLANDIMLIDVHRPAQSVGWNMNLALSMNGPMGWQQTTLDNYRWLNAGVPDTTTYAIDYRSVKAGAPAGTGSDWFQLNLMARGGTDTGGGVGGQVYIDNVRFVPFATPPAAAVFTFDTSAGSFIRQNATSPEVTFSTQFGGTITSTAPDATWHIQVAKYGFSGDALTKLQACASGGGTVSYDIIAPLGTLANRGLGTVFQIPGPWTWNQAWHTIAPSSVVALGDGNEIARVTIPAADFGATFITAGDYNFFIGFDGPSATPVTFHFDNLMFSPTPAGAALTFEGPSAQNFVALPNSSVAADSSGLVISNPPDYEGGASATFDAASSDPQVTAIYEKLLVAATQGGILRYKVKSIVISERAGAFGGLNITTAYNIDGYPQDYTWVDQSALTVGGDPEADPVVPPSETPAGFVRVVDVTLYPQGATNTDGFVLTQGAASYEFQIKGGFNSGAATTSTLTIDDFEVITNADPEVIYAPPLPTGAASFVGRVLSNAQTDGVFSATGLPPGITIDPATGLITGTPTANGTYNVVFSVTRNGVTDATDSVVWEISGLIDAAAPVITSFSVTGNTAVITWSGTGSTPVTVLRSPTLAEGSWTAISTNDTDGTHTDTEAPAGKAFYRVSIP